MAGVSDAYRYYRGAHRVVGPIVRRLRYPYAIPLAAAGMSAITFPFMRTAWKRFSGYGRSKRYGGYGTRRGKIRIRRAQRGYLRRAGYYGRYNVPVFKRGELKFHDVVVDDASVSIGGTVAEDSCVAISQGVGESQRVGRVCTIKSIQWRYNLRMLAGTDLADSSDIVRVILYQDRQTNGGGATSTLIFEDNNFQSFLNLANSSRFTILYDRTHNVFAPAAAGNGTANDFSTKDLSFYFRKKCSIPIEYNNTTGALTEVRTNNIGVFLFSKEGLCQFESNMRLRFQG